MKARLALALLLPAPLWAQEVPPQAVSFVQAVQNNGCAMSDTQAEVTLPGLGLSVADVQGALELVYAGGGARLDTPERFTLTEVWCQGDAQAMLAAVVASAVELEPWAPAFTQAEGVAVLGAIRANDCAVTEAEAELLFPPLGLSPAVVRDVSAILLQDGLAEYRPGEGLALDVSFCGADAGDDAATLAQALSAYVEDQ